MSDIERRLRHAFPDRAPTAAELGEIDDAYRARLGTAAPSRRRPMASVAALVVAVVAVGWIATRTTPVAASLTEFADAARVVGVDELPAGSYFFTASEGTFAATVQTPDEDQFTYLVHQRRRMWTRPGGSTVIETTVTGVTFLSDGDEVLWRESGQEAFDQVGMPRVVAVEGSTHAATERDWPTDPDDLLEEVRAFPQVETDTDAVDSLIDLIIESPAGPQLRAATIEALARLDLDLVARTPTDATFSTDDSDSRLVFSIDHTGQVRLLETYNLGFPLPDGQPSGRVVYEPTVVVDALPPRLGTDS